MTTADYQLQFGSVTTAPEADFAADFLGSLSTAQVAARNAAARFDQMVAPDIDEAAIDALIAWSLDPDAVAPDAAERLRAEAWGYDRNE